ncbi:hypothetical protein JDFR1000234_37 [uncultured archaeal virus]|uniref:Uncharacterized protein n=1 Tax=uncultured archaeal virus TaxID=1960247 RepID=A0A1S5Y347_9VIRU|nr:hypothetical protein JDFR1000234_37 [uncultured archaeal virus]
MKVIKIPLTQVKWRFLSGTIKMEENITDYPKIAKWIEKTHKTLLAYLLCFFEQLRFYDYNTYKDYSLFWCERKKNTIPIITVSDKGIAIYTKKRYDSKKLENEINQKIVQVVNELREREKLPYTIKQIVLRYHRKSILNMHIYFVEFKEGDKNR